jgi:hypothetical protein
VAHATLKRIAAVVLGKKTKIVGSASADRGLASVKLSFGDGMTAKLHLAANGSFKVKHRYRKAKSFKVKLSVTGKGGESAQASRRARVKR